MPAARTALRPEAVLLRLANEDEAADLLRLALLDGARPLGGPALVAVENGSIVAALCLSTGRAVADPFVPSLDLVELLRHHAARRWAPPVTARRHRLLLGLALRAGRLRIGA